MSAVIAIEHDRATSLNYVTVEWMLGNTCTYACSYCPANLHDGSVPWIDHQKILRFVDRLYEHYTRGLGKTVWLHYTGGEPTVYPAFKQLVSTCAENGFKQSLTSNGVRSLGFWRKVLPFLDRAILTYHSEFADREHFFDVVRELRQQISVHVNVTMLPAKFDACREVALGLISEFDDVTVNCKPLRVGFGRDLYDYTPEQLAHLKTPLRPRRRTEPILPRTVMAKVYDDGSRMAQQANMFILNGENRWQGWRCGAGVESLQIKPTGEIFAGICRVGGLVGMVDDDDLKLPTDFLTCTRDVCNCIADILNTKLAPK